MIDIENAVFTAVATALRARFSGVNVDSDVNYSPAKFPTVCIVEADNYAYLPSRDSASNENHAVVVFEVNAFSNKTNGKRQECKALLATVDEVMNGLGFTRNTKIPFGEANMFRIFARYTAVVSKDKKIYRR